MVEEEEMNVNFEQRRKEVRKFAKNRRKFYFRTLIGFAVFEFDRDFCILDIYIKLTRIQKLFFKVFSY